MKPSYQLLDADHKFFWMANFHLSIKLVLLPVCKDNLQNLFLSFLHIFSNWYTWGHFIFSINYCFQFNASYCQI